jgi:hypothetical protein
MQIPEANDNTDPLVAANSLFHSVYQLTGQAVLPPAVVFLETDYLVLLRRGPDGSFVRVKEEAITPVIYHDLKMVAHLPLAVFVLLLPYATNATEEFPIQSALQYYSKYN